MSTAAPAAEATIPATAGEPIRLRIVVRRAIAPEVDVELAASVVREREQGGAFEEVNFWRERLRAEPAGEAPGGLAFELPWVASFRPPGEALDPFTSGEVTFTARCRPLDGTSTIEVRSRSRLRLRAIRVTREPAFTRIMRHEFSRAAPPHAFDPTVCVRYVRQLTLEQRRLLLTHPVPAGRPSRLVAFVTLTTPDKHHPMGADYCGEFPANVPPGDFVTSNASLSVFRCAPEEDVTLLCHTEHFHYNVHNPDSEVFLRQSKKTKVNGKEVTQKPAEWLSRRNPHPPPFHIAMVQPRKTSAIYNRVFTSAGRDVMNGNCVHGEVNTKGCWMLFRNYNWPRASYEAFARVYTDLSREGAPEAKVRAALAKLGYDAASHQGLRTDSLVKFLAGDANYAYTWFLHDVVGLCYWGHESFVNDFEVHGRRVIPRFPADTALPFDPYAGLTGVAAQRRPGETSVEHEGKTYPANAHPVPEAGEPDRTPDDITTNALGERNAEAFVPLKGNVPESLLAKAAWAEVYLFRERDDVPLPKFP